MSSAHVCRPALFLSASYRLLYLIELYNSSSHNMSELSWSGCFGSCSLILPSVWSLHEAVTSGVRGTQDYHQHALCLFCYVESKVLFRGCEHNKHKTDFARSYFCTQAGIFQCVRCSTFSSRLLLMEMKYNKTQLDPQDSERWKNTKWLSTMKGNDILNVCLQFEASVISHCSHMSGGVMSC